MATTANVRGVALPDFLGIGAQKSGTTWLYNNLKAHPDTYLPYTKELHYFDRHLSEGIKYYSSFFQTAGNKKKGEITPAYSILEPVRIRYIRATMPDLRIILLLRNPIDRAWSHAMMGLVEKMNRPYEDVREEELVAHFLSSGSRRRGDYATIIDRWLSAYPAEQIFIGFYDDIVASPKEILTHIFKHIKISVTLDWSNLPYDRVFNKSLGIPLPKQYRAILTDLYFNQINNLTPYIGSRASTWLKTG